MQERPCYQRSQSMIIFVSFPPSIFVSSPDDRAQIQLVSHHTQRGFLPATTAALEAVRGREAAGVELVGTVSALVVLLVHVVSVLLGVLAGLDFVNFVHALGLGELVDLSANNGGKGLLGESVADGLAYRSGVVSMANSSWLEWF